MNEAEKPPRPPSAEAKKIPDSPSQPEIDDSLERQFGYLQEELQRQYDKLNSLFEFDKEDLEKEIKNLTKRQTDIKNLEETLRDSKDDYNFKYDKERTETEIKRLDAQIAAVRPKKVGIIGFRKSVEDTAAKTPLQEAIDAARQKLREIETKAEELAQINKMKVPLLAKELGIEDPITSEKINAARIFTHKELQESRNKLNTLNGEIHLKRAQLPVLGAYPNSDKPRLHPLEVKDIDPNKKFNVLAYGGTSYNERAREGRWPDERFKGFLSDIYGLQGSKIGYGAGEMEGRKIIVLRQRQNLSNRGGYPYTIVLEPGEEVLQKAGGNGAVIVRNILADPVLKHYALNEPNYFFGNLNNLLLARLNQSYFNTFKKSVATANPLVDNPQNESGFTVVGPSSIPEPTPEELAEVIANMDEDSRRKFTFIIRGHSAHGKAIGANHIWDDQE